ncbi:MAG: 3-dehydroquinate synthase [Armatimonadota bacterium]|nr:3-dehydroquinate synthase [Armatimonadota bacterium]MDR7484790.1 3-dehydroquinate synthase [Armatimonadota bacterium]MDR7531905.1 3-dehydroquinate synthase [Armatimonadota bacterium]MDR7534750.1 3-dehydroquinate synthase [Armatimonadota bacterium]
MTGSAMRAITLVGPMGSGKSAAGRALADRLGWAFVDTDVLIADREGRSIAELFRERGEAGFRRVERAVVREVARRSRVVIATGGGAIVAPVSRRLLHAAGPVFYLRAPVEVLAERVGGDPGRPLLGDDPRAALARLVVERERFYEADTVVIDGTAPLAEVVDAMVAALDARRRTVRVRAGAAAYDVKIGAGTLALLGVDLQRLGVQGTAAIVTHTGLARRFGPAVTAALEAVGLRSVLVTVPAGERAKSLRQAARVIDRLAAAGLERDATVLAVGGGVVGDLAGFVAGVYMRGIRLVQVPTTLLAQIDSSVGGKTAVNHSRAKNLIGVYHQPALVVADLATLRSLPAREQKAGLAEAVKYAMTLDAALLDLLERYAVGGDRREIEILGEIVTRCVALKARVVEEDEREQGPREILNYGHTVGHAVEAAWPGRFVHGEAVAVGMQVEARVAVRLGLLSEDAAARQRALLERLGLPVTLPAGPVESVLEAIRLDKKRRAGRLRCTLPEGVGRARLGVEVDDAVLREVLVACQESW